MMEYRERIRAISEYCGEYYDHSNMIDEKNSYKFNIAIPEEGEIRKYIQSGVQVIILTGEAGDGKTRLMNELKSVLSEYDIISDFSEYSNPERFEIINRIEQIISSNSSQKIIIAANVGILFQTIIKKNAELLELIKHSKNVKIINFQKRNIAKNKSIIEGIIHEFTKDVTDNNCIGCGREKNCPFKKNILQLCSDIVQENIKVMCDALFLSGEHITFRELLSLISYMITNGYDCKSVGDNNIDPFNFFDKANNVTFRKFYKFDPAFSKMDIDDKLYDSIVEQRKGICTEKQNYAKAQLTEYISQKRQHFFLGTDNTYHRLPVEYISEFKQILDCLQEKPYYKEMTNNDELFFKLKRGLVRMTSADESDLNIQLYDTPYNISNDIKTRFTNDIETITMVWNRKDFDFNKRVCDEDCCNNCFCLTAMIMRGQKSIPIHLTINYQLFRYIMLASDGYISNNAQNVANEFGLSEFFRMILLNSESAYNHIIVEFVNKKKYVDFEMIRYNHTTVFGDSEEKIRIKKL